MTLFANAIAPNAYDDWELAPEDERQRVIADRLDSFIGFCRDALPYYRDRLPGYAPSATHSLAEVPVMTASDLRAAVPPEGRSLVTNDSEPRTVFQSGGTTGTPKTTLFSHAELDLLDHPNARGFYAVGLTPEDRVADLWAVGSLYMTFVHINRMLQQYGCLNFPFANHTDPVFVHGTTRLFDINCFTGVSSVMLDTLRAFPEAEGMTIDKVFFGGERLYESDEKELRERFNTKIIAAPGYGTVDTWYIGYQCLESPRDLFHAHDDLTYIEIVDEESGRHCDPGAVGMLYATPFVRRLTPVVRYRVGDLARWVDGPCPCGRTTRRFALLGRGDDVLRIAYDSVDYDFVQATVAKIDDQLLAGRGVLSGVIQMEKLRHEQRDQLVVRIETSLPHAERSTIAERIVTAMLSARPSLRDLVHKESVWPLLVELCDAGSLSRNPRTGKLVRVIDSIGEA